MRAKKSLGQNFLNSKVIAQNIVRAAELLPSDTVLEIGPGKGFLTTGLLASGAHVIAVEKDDRMIPLLEEKYAVEIAEKRFTLIHGDIVELTSNKDKGSALRDTKVDPLSLLALPVNYKLVANIPYYITGYILRAFLEAKQKPERMIIMVQKEVADRIVARDKKESILSIAIKAYGTPRIVKRVPARYFTPAPKVDSAVLAITNISNKNFVSAKDEKKFFEIMKAGFAHKRKQLAGNLKDTVGEHTHALLEQSGIHPSTRAEDTALEQWILLSRLSQKK